MALTLSAKGPSDVIRRTWEPGLAEGDGIASFTLTPTGCAIASSKIDGDAVVFFVSGGTAGSVATIAARAVTDDGETLTETFYVPVYGPSITNGETARDYVSFAMRKITGVGEDPEGDELEDGLEQLAGMLAMWRIDGLDLGVPLPLTASTVLSIPDEFTMAVKYNLRVLLHSTYGAEAMAALTQADIRMAEDGKRLVANVMLSLDDLKFENNLLPVTRPGSYFF